MLNMQARHRSPAIGYRSGSLGLGLDVPSTGEYGFYNSDNRSRPGFGRGHHHPRSSQPPTPRKVDIFMEAGRLATEYMISHGLLPAAILSSKWQNGVLKEFRSAEGGNMEFRASALSRLGSATSDLGFGRKRYHDELDKRNHAKVRKTVAPYNNYGSDLGRDYGRSRSWSCRDRSEFVMEGDDDDDNVFERHREKEQVSKDVGNLLPGSSSVQPLPKGNKFGDVESGQVKHSILDDMDSKGATSTVVVSEVLHENGWQTSKVDSEETNLTTVIDEMKNVARQDESKIHVSPIDSPIEQCLPKEDSSSNSDTNLLAFCKFAKVPTKTRSSLTHRNKKLGHAPDKEDKTSTIGAIVRSEVFVNDNINDDPSVRMPSNKLSNSKDPVSETSKEFFLQFVVEDAKNSSPVHGVEEDTCAGPPSLPDKRFMYASDREAGQGVPILKRLGTLDKERGEKRACKVGDMSEGKKKARQSLSSVVSEGDECFHFSSLNNNTSTSQKETTLPKEKITLANAESCMGNGSQFPDSEAFVENSQEKQLNPSSFKTCDLNLMEVSDVTENHQSDTILIYPSIPETNRETVDLDVDVAFSDSNLCSDYGMQVNDIKEIEVIDLEKDSASGDKTFDNIHEKMNNEFPGLEGFSSNAPNADDIPDVHDNYDGLMLSEYLSTFPNCTSIANVVSPMQTDTGLNDDEGTLVDDDSIYTSLGEIPLSMPDI